MDCENDLEIIYTKLRGLVRHLIEVDGLDPALVLAGVHAEAITAITVNFGGDQAAASARRAADRVEGMPSFAEVKFASMPVAGRA